MKRVVPLALLLVAAPAFAKGKKPDPKKAAVAAFKSFYTTAADTPTADFEFLIDDSYTKDDPDFLVDAKPSSPIDASQQAGSIGYGDATATLSEDGTAAFLVGRGDFMMNMQTTKGAGRGTAVMDLVDGKWKLVAAMWDEPRADKDVAGRADAEAKYVDVPDNDRSGGELATALRGALADTDSLANALSDRKDVIVLGSAPGDKLVGKAAKKVAKWGLSFEVQGGVQAGTTSSGTVGWAAARVIATGKSGKPTPYRVFLIFEKADDAWQVVSAQFSYMPPPEE